MSQAPRGKPTAPLDILQSMTNAILIETGKALNGLSKEAGKDMAQVRIRTAVPSMVENFHQALDDLECDIVRAKSVLMRDLKELRAKRLALENPAPIVEKVNIGVEQAAPSQAPVSQINILANKQESTETDVIHENRESKSPQKQRPATPLQTVHTETAKSTVSSTTENTQGQAQKPTPPSSADLIKPIGLGINTDAATEPDQTTDHQESAVDSLFDDNDGNTDLMNFEDTTFLQDAENPPQGNEQSQPDEGDFDMSVFGTISQDFGMADLQPSNQAAIANDASASKEQTDSFLMESNEAGDDMDLDDFLGGDNTEFDMYNTETEINHDLDSNFFDT